jgi:hypothetical protein
MGNNAQYCIQGFLINIGVGESALYHFLSFVVVSSVT